MARDRSEYAHLDPLLQRHHRLPDGDPERQELRDQLIQGYLPVVEHIASRFRGRGEPVEDLQQAGSIGLVNAIDRFDPDQGYPFLGFAIPTVTGEIRRHFRDRTWATHVPRRLRDLQTRMTRAQEELYTRLHRAPRVSELAEHLDLDRDEVIDALAAAQSYSTESYDAPVAAEGSVSLEEVVGDVDAELELTEYRTVLRPLLAELPDRERAILVHRFFGNLTQTQIARRVGISQMHVSRLLSQTLATLRERMNGEPAGGSS